MGAPSLLAVGRQASAKSGEGVFGEELRSDMD
jgi:hypothetical protein